MILLRGSYISSGLKNRFTQIFVLLEIMQCILLCNVAIAQGIIAGRVTEEETGVPLAGVTVMLNSPAGKLLKYTITSGDGSFRIGPENGTVIVSGCELVFSCMGYAQVLERVEGTAVKQWNVKMRPTAIQIKEVVVRAPKVQMSGDTISYNVQSFANTQDKTIGDVLKRIPGIEVSKEGQVKYNGEAINKFYIEGVDLLEGRYGLATNNINQKDVAKVEVLENHQPVKALKDVAYSDKAAINIKLNEGAKAKWLGQILAQGGVGAQQNLTDGVKTPNDSRIDEADYSLGTAGKFLWNSRLFAMSIGAKMQSMTTFKTNNIGENLSGERNSFTVDALSSGGSSDYSLPRYINVSPAITPDLDQQRASFNKSILFNSSNLWKIGQDYTIKGEVSYAYNQIKSANSSQTDYFFEDGGQTTYESAASVEREHGVQAIVNLSANTEHYFLKNKLMTNLSWSDINTSLRWNYENVSNSANEDGQESGSGSDSSLKKVLQLAGIPSFKLSNNFQFVKKLDKATLTAMSVNKLMAEPLELNVSPFFEKVNTSAFFTDEYMSLTHSAGRWNFTTTAGISAVLRKMRRENDTLNNAFNSLNAYAKLLAVYKSGRVRITFDMPFNYYGYWYKVSLGDLRGLGNPVDINDLTNFGNSRNNSLFVSPRIALRWQVTPRLTANLSGKAGRNPITSDSFFAGSILSNYRSVRCGNVLYTHDDEYSMYLGMTYKNPLSLFYASVSASRNFYKKGTIEQQTFSGDYIINSQILQRNNVGIWIFNGEISKGLDFIKGKVAVSANYCIYDMQSIVNNVFTPYISRQLNIKTTISSSFARWGNLDYDLYYGMSALAMEWKNGGDGNNNNGSNNQPATNMVKQSLSINLIPLRWLTINMQGEHYYNQITAEQSQHLYWIDAGLTFKACKHLELSASVTNLLNCKTYSYIIYNGLSSVSRQYTIRPRNIMFGIYWEF